LEHRSALERLPAIVWSPRYEVDIGAHVFPTSKYRRVYGTLVQRGIPDEAFVEPSPASDEDLARVHTAAYLRKIRDDDFTMAERVRLEVPMSEALGEAMRLCCGGTLLACIKALEDGVAAHLGGGFHHSFADHGEGFCLLNDIAVAAAALVDEHRVRRVAVVDLDVHHGNGTAAIFADDERVFTFSMHQQRNYPADKPPSDLDVGLADGTGDEAYLALLDEHLGTVLSTHRPDLVLYLAGADPYRGDQLGGLGLTLKGLRTRDWMVFTRCLERGVAVAATLAGGYAMRTEDTVEIHAATIEEAFAAVR
jgi:acetoin utilization deacetylase AcuC-like enzyme